MTRAVHPETEAVNADSFLDIVASVVSIMIIMVLMTGLKIKRSPVVVAPTSDMAQSREALAADVAGEQALRRDILKTTVDTEIVRREIARCKQERDMLALEVNALAAKTQASDQQLNVAAAEDPAVMRRMAEARLRVEELERLRTLVETTPAAPIQIESYPTPISRPVAGREIHFQLRGGRVVPIPLESLIEQFKSDAERSVQRLRDQSELTDIVGPEGGFRLRYTLERVDVNPDRPGARGGSYVRLRRWTLIPVADDLGETLDEALRPDSQFRQVLADRRVRGATVTLWTYPDSFETFRRIKKELYLAGFPVAGRPLPEGMPISGSPEGSKSASE
jgi:hypothetical protein